MNKPNLTPARRLTAIEKNEKFSDLYFCLALPGKITTGSFS